MQNTHAQTHIYAYIDVIDRMITWMIAGQINGTFLEDTIQRTFECRAYVSGDKRNYCPPKLTT